MIDITKQKVIFVRRGSPASPALAPLEQMLGETCALELVTAGASFDLAAFQAQHAEGTAVFLELGWIAEAKIPFDPAWRAFKVVLVKTEELTGVQPWLEAFSTLNVSSPSPAELRTAAEIAIAPERVPGIVALCASGVEVYFEKITRIQSLGQKTDRLLDYFGGKHPELADQLYNLRQLSYALVHQALRVSSGVSQVSPVVDFQIAADSGRIAFSTRFSAPPSLLQTWARELAANGNLLLRNAALSADLLAFTELSALKQIEVKALIAAKGEYSGAAGSVLFARVENFAADPAVVAAQKKAKFFTLSKLPESKEEPLADKAAGPSPSSAPEAGEEEAGTTPAAKSPAPAPGQLNFKLKADMLETEKANLQGLVKKKSQLISDLTKDVNRAQRDVMEAQRTATKEILKMRMEAEKARNEARDAKKKLAAFQRKAAEAAEAEAKARESGAAPKQDFEKDFKQSELARRNLEAQLKEQTEKAARADEMVQRLRREATQVAGEMSLLKQKLLQTTQKLASAEMASASAQKSAGTDDFESFKASKKATAESKGKEQELEKTIKSLQLKLDAAEKNLKVGEQMFEKQLEAAEKAGEEAKRQRAEMVTKLEVARLEAKKKLEESNDRERMLRKQIEQLGGTPPAKAS